MNDFQAFQGDVLFRGREELPEEGIEILTHLILAEGEATGHKHIVRGSARLYEKTTNNRNRFLQVLDKEVTVEHEEHHTVTLEKGIYEIGIGQEYDHFAEEARQVKD